MHSELPDILLRAAREHHLLDRVRRLVVACSGGADSVALLRALHARSGMPGLPELSVCHLDHGLRGDESRRDRAFVEQLAQRLGLACYAESVQLPDASEAAAREARLRFFGRAAEHFDADAVAAAHTADDQAETVLLRVLRGTGLEGLRGIPWQRPLHPDRKRPRLIRPLLEVTRQQLEDYLRAHDQTWRTDATNRMPVYRRNAVRLDLLPELEQRFNPNVRQALRQLAALAEDAVTLLQPRAAEQLNGMSESDADEIRLRRPALLAHPPAAVRWILREALHRLGAPGDTRAFEAVARLQALAEEDNATRLSLPGGVVAAVEYDDLVLRQATPPPEAFTFSLPVPGAVTLPDGRHLLARLSNRPADHGSQPSVEQLDYDRLGRPTTLTVRNRRPGDRFQPLGMQGRKTVGDFLSDARVAPRERRQAIVVTRDETIIWLAPHRIAEGAKITDHTQTILQLHLKPPDGLPGKA